MMGIQSETYFVITRISGTEWLFYCQKNGLVWLPDAEEAIRFCREEDAKRIMSVVGASGLFAKVMEVHSRSAEISESSGHTNQHQVCGQFVEPLPKDVYWKEDNFYDKLTGWVMGSKFYDTWKDRAGEFPTAPL